MIQLTAADQHHWAPIPSVMDNLAAGIPAKAKVLEIGPGHTPFNRADTFVDFVDVPNAKGKTYKVDIATERLPFKSKSFDFVFCRHALEDMYNPFLICEEMSRVGKAGYIETPSPIAEMCRGVDGGAPGYRGYHHHRFIIWAHQGELRFVSKYPLVEYLKFNDALLVSRLREARYWNTYYQWTGRINVNHVQSPLNYDIPKDYQNILVGATMHSMASTDEYWKTRT